MVVVFSLVTAVGWWVFSHTEQLGDAEQVDSATAESAAPAARPTTTLRGSTGRLDETGGLITGPAGLRIGTVPSAIDNRVFMVGDSVLQGSGPYVPDLLPDWAVISDTRVGRFLGEAIRVVKKRAKKDLGEIAVLNLGNNYGQDPVAFAADVDTMMGLLVGVEHVIWVNAGEFEPAQEEVNQVLRAAVERYPNLTLIDWNGYWDGNPKLTVSDDLHLTPAGNEAYAGLIADAVARITRLAKQTPKPSPAKPRFSTEGVVPSGSSGPARRTSRTTVVPPKATPTTESLPETTQPPETTAPPDTAPPETAPPITTP